ncbi:hypothetical protein H0H87_005470, partial [Tephrocybe sp. NHM501043]
MASHSSRKSSYKLPPTTITDKLVSQEARRSKVATIFLPKTLLMDFNRRWWSRNACVFRPRFQGYKFSIQISQRRAERFDSTRNLETFADLSLGISEDEDDVDAPAPPHGSIAQYAAMVSQPVDPSSIATHVTPLPTVAIVEPYPPEAGTSSSPPAPTKKPKKKRRGKTKPNKWADGCMYAELLEMVSDPSEAWSDGLPADLESGWVALAPVPQGKRCLAVTQTAVG